MMEVLRTFRQWFIEVFKHWYGWVGGSATAGIVSIGPSLNWWSNPGARTYTALIAAGLIVSVFQTWREEHLKVEKLENLSERPLVVKVHKWEYGSTKGVDAPLDLVFQVELLNEGLVPLIVTECNMIVSDSIANSVTSRAIPIEGWVAWGTKRPIPDLHGILGSKLLQPHDPVEGWFGFKPEGFTIRNGPHHYYRLLFRDDKGRQYPVDTKDVLRTGEIGKLRSDN